MKNFKKVVSVITLALVMLVSVNVSAQFNEKLSNEHNEICIGVIKNSTIDGRNSFEKNQKIIIDYLQKTYNVKLNTLKKEVYNNPFNLLKAGKKEMSSELYNALEQLLNMTKGKKVNDAKLIINDISKNIEMLKLNKEDKNKFNDVISIYYGSLTFWFSDEVSEIMNKKGFDSPIKLNNTRESVDYIINLKPSPDEYWKIAACDGVGAVVGGVSGFGIGAVFGAVGASACSAINLW